MKTWQKTHNFPQHLARGGRGRDWLKRAYAMGHHGNASMECLLSEAVGTGGVAELTELLTYPKVNIVPTWHT